MVSGVQTGRYTVLDASDVVIKNVVSPNLRFVSVVAGSENIMSAKHL